VFGIIFSLYQDTADAVVLGDERAICANSQVLPLYSPFSIIPNNFYFGGVYDAMGNLLNNLEEFNYDYPPYFLTSAQEGLKYIAKEHSASMSDDDLAAASSAAYAEIASTNAIVRSNFANLELVKPVDIKAVGIIPRKSINTPLITGIKVIDSIIPIGRGQRELIIGDRRSGKSTIAMDTIQNQRRGGEVTKSHVKSIYVASGQKASSVLEFYKISLKHNFVDTVFVIATAAFPAPLQYLAPYTGCALGE